MFAPWPKPLDADFKEHYGLDQCYLEMVDARCELVTLGRNLRREANLAPAKKPRFVLKPTEAMTPHDLEVLKLLLNAEAVATEDQYQPKKGTPTARGKLGELYLPLEGLIDVAAEKARLQKELSKAAAEIEKAQQKLNNPQFVQKVPPNVLAEHQKRLAEWQAKHDHLAAALQALES